MSVTTPRERRRSETKNEIVDAAWRLARRDGLAAVSMRGLGSEVGLKAQSLYAYFDSKGGLYDAMFRQGHETLQEMMSGWPERIEQADDARRIMKELALEFARFCTGDPVRYQLLFQRVIPEWEPDEESYALAVAQLESLRDFLVGVGIESSRALDMWTAIMSGLTAQQLSNDPGGDRWLRLLDDAVDCFFDFYGPTDTGDRA